MDGARTRTPSGGGETMQTVEIAEEAADVQIYLLMLTDKLGIDLVGAVEAKIEKNRSKYSADEIRGSAAKARRSGSE